MAVIEVERVGLVALVRLNRPDARNALNPELIVRLATTWEELAGGLVNRVVPADRVVPIALELAAAIAANAPPWRCVPRARWFAHRPT